MSSVVKYLLSSMGDLAESKVELRYLNAKLNSTRDIIRKGRSQLSKQKTTVAGESVHLRQQVELAEAFIAEHSSDLAELVEAERQRNQFLLEFLSEVPPSQQLEAFDHFREINPHHYEEIKHLRPNEATPAHTAPIGQSLIYIYVNVNGVWKYARLNTLRSLVRDLMSKHPEVALFSQPGLSARQKLVAFYTSNQQYCRDEIGFKVMEISWPFD